MTPAAFLRAVAAVMPGKVSASRTSVMAQFAHRLAADFDPEQLTAEAADKIAERIGEALPTYAALADAVRANVAPRKHRAPVVPAAWPPPRHRDEAAEDHEWWSRRITAWEQDPAAIELANLQGALRVLTGRHPMQKGRHHPRPAIVYRVQQRIHELEAAGIQPAEIRPYTLTRSNRLIADAEGHGPTVTTRPAPSQPARQTRNHVEGAELQEMRRRAGIQVPEGDA